METTAIVTTRPCHCVYCKREVPLGTPIDTLPFFEARGPGTQDHVCEGCRYHRVAHERVDILRNSHVCDTFVPMLDGYPHDSYYCGCKGWD